MYGLPQGSHAMTALKAQTYTPVQYRLINGKKIWLKYSLTVIYNVAKETLTLTAIATAK